MQHVFIIGSRGLPAKYGGFETFVSIMWLACQIKKPIIILTTKA